MRAAYQIGRAPEWQILLSQKTPQQLSRLMHYHNDIVELRRKQISAYQNDLEKLASVEEKIQATVSTLQKERNALQQEHARLLTKKQQREQTLARIRGVIKNKDQELQQQKNQQKELEQIIALASRISGKIGFEKDHTPFKQRKGKMPWPVNGSIQSSFGSTRNGGLRWNGVLLAASPGTPVKAVHSGRVLFADWLPGQGLLMIIDHGDQYMSLYAHNEALLKEPGEWVSGGDTIARSGNTGGLQTASLYFEIRYQGSPINPAAWCKRG